MCEMLFCNQNAASVLKVTILLNVTFLTATPLLQRGPRLIKRSQHLYFIKPLENYLGGVVLYLLFSGCNSGCEGSLTLRK